MYKGSLFFTSSPTFVIYFHFGDSHSDRCKVVSHCGFELAFLWWLVMLSIFSCTCWASALLFGKMSVQFFCLCFNWAVCLMLRCMNYLHMLGTNLLLVVSFANIFSHSIRSLFILLIVSFAMQKLLSLIRSHLFIFAFISFTLGDRFKKICCDLCISVFCLCFPLGVLYCVVLHIGL